MVGPRFPGLVRPVRLAATVAAVPAEEEEAPGPCSVLEHPDASTFITASWGELFGGGVTNGCAVNPNTGALYVVGYETLFPDGGFILKYDSDLNLIASARAADVVASRFNGVAVNESTGDVYVVGVTDASNYQMLVMRFDEDLVHIGDASLGKAVQSTTGAGIAIDQSSGAVIAVGWTLRIADHVSVVAKYSPSLVLDTAKECALAGGALLSHCVDVHRDTGDIYVGGAYSGSYFVQRFDGDLGLLNDLRIAGISTASYHGLKVDQSTGAVFATGYGGSSFHPNSINLARFSSALSLTGQSTIDMGARVDTYDVDIKNSTGDVYVGGRMVAFGRYKALMAMYDPGTMAMTEYKILGGANNYTYVRGVAYNRCTGDIYSAGETNATGPGFQPALVERNLVYAPAGVSPTCLPSIATSQAFPFVRTSLGSAASPTYVVATSTLSSATPALAWGVALAATLGPCAAA
jgi:hypothetical protein